jgi:hypothetical protein
MKDNLGNPLAIAAGAQAANSFVQNKTVQKVGKVVLIGGVSIVGIMFTRAQLRKSRARRVMRKGTPEVQQAINLRIAMKGSNAFPSEKGFNFFTSLPTPFGVLWDLPDGTDEDLIYKTAAKISNWPQVQKDYKDIFYKELISDLRDELDNDELEQFYNVLNRLNTKDTDTATTTTSSGTKVNHYRVGELVYAVRDGVKDFLNEQLFTVDDTYDIGDEIGKITKVLIKNGKVVYQLEHDGFCIPYLKRCSDYYVRHEDVTNMDNLSGLGKIDLA